MADKHYIVVTPFFPSPDNWRGAYCFDFVKALRREVEVEGRGRQWSVNVFVPGDGEDYEIGGVKVYRFPTRQLPSNILPFLFARHNTRSFLNKVKEVLNSTVDLHLQPTPTTAPQVAVVHAHTANFAIYALAAKRAFGCKALLHHHDPQSFGLNLGKLRHCSIYNAWLFRRLRSLFEQIDCHVFISEMVKRSFLLAPDASWTNYENYRLQMRGPAFFHCRPVRINRSIILHNGVDTSIFHPAEGKVNNSTVDLHLSPTPKTFTIGCIGNFIDWKDQATLIKAVGLLKEPVKVIFVGSGPTLESCKKLANSIVNLSLQPQPRFEFRTEVPHEQLASFYHSLDLFVLPSYFEGFGCVFTESYASGVPFIACEGQGPSELMAECEKNLWLCKPMDAAGLSAKISHYIECRPVQHLDKPIAFDELIPRFARELEQ